MIRRMLLLLAAALAAMACIWDSDTLAAEAKGMPEVLDVITGRFDRNPPLYYEMRLTRVSAEVAKRPQDLALYDDAGAACDRLGRHDEAVSWMRRKAVQLAKHPDKEHQYRYHANLGTFLVHGWLAAGALPDERSVLQNARDEIAKAIEINPDAHFGREAVQLKMMDWMVGRLSDPPQDIPFSAIPVEASERKSFTEGLVGLVALGNAWESPDLFSALAKTLLGQRDSYLAGAAGARMRELIAGGKKLLGPETKDYYTSGAHIVDGHKATFEREYAALRKAADERTLQRETYMLARLKVGKHPDTDPEFWSDWTEPVRPELSTPPLDPKVIALIVFVVGAIGIPWVLIRWMRSRRMAR